MILVDSSVWIDYFNGSNTKESDYLDNVLGNRVIALGDLILAEILQGFRFDKDYKIAKNILESLPVFELLGKHMAISSGKNFRILRKQGITVRKNGVELDQLAAIMASSWNTKNSNEYE